MKLRLCNTTYILYFWAFFEKKRFAMRYRRLTNDELKELEKEFVRFLASNTVTGDDWEKIKKEDSEKAEKLIGMFSDIVFEKTISKIEYLEYRSPKDLKVFHCKDDIIEMVGIMVEGNSDIDFSKNIEADKMIHQLQASQASLKMMAANKKYKKTKELEIFDMMQWGCLISDGKLFQTLNAMKPK